ncbi:hypothetical protein Poly21_52930 [Allorhodopirellula heiligendammensis]|uniref:Uncharacterized protein n=1 Tax=Allorhodopirellula heiligendammensis TaxID=2714739 RepID=A0A5C6BHR3_9BACT|nr:hypothetical protein Poly21_52930 [Allorhodopirellula heiligendammensis]
MRLVHVWCSDREYVLRENVETLTDQSAEFSTSCAGRHRETPGTVAIVGKRIPNLQFKNTIDFAQTRLADS